MGLGRFFDVSVRGVTPFLLGAEKSRKNQGKKGISCVLRISCGEWPFFWGTWRKKGAFCARNWYFFAVALTAQKSLEFILQGIHAFCFWVGEKLAVFREKNALCGNFECLVRGVARFFRGGRSKCEFPQVKLDVFRTGGGF